MKPLAVCVLLAGCGLPELSSEDVFGLEANPRVWMFGTVSVGQSPAAGATVKVVEAMTTTDSNGAFRLDGLTLADREVVITRQGFEPVVNEVDLHPGGNRFELKLAGGTCSVCGAEQVCDDATAQCVQAASLTGIITDSCSGAAVIARVTVQGKSTCSMNTGKGFWSLQGLKPGGPQTLAAGKPGYQPFSTAITLKSGFNTFDPIKLNRVGGCSAPQPAGECQ